MIKGKKGAKAAQKKPPRPKKQLPLAKKAAGAGPYRAGGRVHHHSGYCVPHVGGHKEP